MSLYKTKGIVLKTHKLGESDRIITILTGNHGKIGAVAKGVRKTKSKFGSRLEPFTHVDLLLYKGRNLDIVTQAEIIDSFADIRENFDRITFGSAMLDLVNKVSMEGERDFALYNLLHRSLGVISQLERNFRLLLIAFDIKLMSISGYMPKLEHCVICGKNTTTRIRFNYERGGITCEECNPPSRDSIVITPAAVELFMKLIRLPLSEVVEFEADMRLEDELYFLMRDYVSYYIQARLKSRECLGQLAH